MKVASRYCDSCNVKISAQDIEDGVALKFDDSYYCKDCKAEILPLVDKKAGKAAGATSKAVSKAVPKAPSAKAPAPDDEDGDEDEKKPASKKPGAATASAKPAGGARPGSSAARKALSTNKSAAVKSGARAAVGSKRPSREEPEDDAEEGDEDDAPEPKKNKMLVPAIAAAAVVILIVIAVAMNSGGNPSSAGAGGDTAEVKKSPQQLAIERETKQWKDALARVKEKKIGERYKAMKTAYDALPDHSVFAQTAFAELEKMEEEYKDAGRVEYERLVKTAKLQAEQGKYEDAVTTMRGFDEDLKGSSWYTSNARAEIEKYQNGVAAKEEAEPLIAKADAFAKEKEFLIAVGVLEAFDLETYRGTPWADRVLKLKAAYEEAALAAGQDAAMQEIEEKARQEELAAAAEKEKQRQELMRKIAGLNWTTIPTDDLFTWKVPEPKPADAWKPQGKELVGRSGGAVLMGNVAAYAGCGDKKWIDVVVRLRYKIVRGGFKLGVRSQGDRFVELSPDVVSDGQYHDLEIQVLGSGDDAFQDVTTGTPRKVKFDAHDSDKGGICLVLPPNAEVWFTDVKVKVVTKE